MPFNRCDQGRLFAANKRSRAEANLNIKSEGSTADVVAEKSTPTRLAQRSRQTRDRQRVFGAHIDVALACSHRVGRDGHALDHTLRITFQHAAIHEGSRIALVGIADHVFLRANGLGHGAPLKAGGIATASASAQSALEILLDHHLRLHLGERFDQRLIAVAPDVFIDLLGIDVAGVLQHDRILTGKICFQMRARVFRAAPRRGCSISAFESSSWTPA